MPDGLCGRSRYARLRGREVHYLEWGKADAPAVVMWHGLARTCRDFDRVAAALSTTHRVVCPDTIGRGLSEWSPTPKGEYCLSVYAQMIVELLDALRITRLDWLGTSMGGSLGIFAGAGVLKGRIRRLVLNDIGPEQVPASLDRIAAYVGSPPAFRTLSGLEAYFRTT